MGNHAAACLSGRDRGSAGTGQSGQAVFGSLFGGTAIKRPRYCATQQGARHPRWKPHGLVPAYQAVNKKRWDTAAEPGAPIPFPHSPALQKQIRHREKCPGDRARYQKAEGARRVDAAFKGGISSILIRINCNGDEEGRRGRSTCCRRNSKRIRGGEMGQQMEGRLAKIPHIVPCLLSHHWRGPTTKLNFGFTTRHISLNKRQT
ncbi:hypothetical protein FQN60_010829 [Etheostoma spectabile]|uniref:Uncharacterized protein n=1 Tax=Etheostoma spectabile TaxID=54343 RepID=A0A5J5DQX6_9PERO|nr:hypothetical protein FQN60_010829 [Etheostoma spectabile]